MVTCKIIKSLRAINGDHFSIKQVVFKEEHLLVGEMKMSSDIITNPPDSNPPLQP